MYQPSLLSQLDHRFPSLQTGRGSEADALALATLLVCGLIGLAPVVTVIAPGRTLPALATVGAVGVGYAVITFVIRRVAVGALVAVFVASTIATNVPLAAAAVPGALGPSVWLFELPLVCALAVGVWQGWLRDATMTRAHWLFFVFVIWAVVAAFFGAGTHPDAAFYFALQFALAGLLFATVAAAVERDTLTLQTVVEAYALAAVGHALFGVAQFIHGGGFKLSILGGRQGFFSRTILVRTPWTTVAMGAHVAGLTGTATELAVLCLLTAPALAVVALQAHGVRRAAIVVTLALFAVVLLATRKDTALVGLVFEIALGAWIFAHDRLPAPDDRSVGAVVGLAAFLIAPAGLAALAGTAVSLPTSLALRSTQYAAALTETLAHPVVGLGGANFPYLATEYGLPAARSMRGTIGKPVHSAPLSILVGTGLVGLALFAATVAAILWTDVGRPETPTLEAGVAAGLVAVLAVASVTVSFVTVPGVMPFFALAGAFVGRTHLTC